MSTVFSANSQHTAPTPDLAPGHRGVDGDAASRLEAHYLALLEVQAAMNSVHSHFPGCAVTSDAGKVSLLEQGRSVLPSITRAIGEYVRTGMLLTESEQKSIRPKAQELVHPLVLRAPFGRRSYEKPLGYAGDYIMVRQILGDPMEGESAYDQLMNYALLQADVAQGHRNRVAVLTELLSKKATEAHEAGRRLRVLSIGCGPAEETFRFLRDHPTPEVADIDLLDFNRETLDWAQARLETVMPKEGPRATVRTIEKSVYELAKRIPAEEFPEYDLVICAGLFDYLTDRFCKRVVDYCVAKVHPGGMVLITNVSVCRDSYFMSNILEWDLIYRDATQVESLLPKSDRYMTTVTVEETGTNVFGAVVKLP